MGLRGRCVRAWSIAALLLACAAAPARAELAAPQVGILANRNNADSLAVARYYAERRGLPADRILELDLPPDETISREDYERLVLHPARRLLEQRGLAGRIRALVTTYGVPLRVAAPQMPSQHRRWAADAAQRLAAARSRLAALEPALQQVAPRPVVRPSSLTVSVAPGGDPDELQLQYAAQALRDAAARLADVPNLDQAAEWTQRLAEGVLQFGGLDAFLQNVPGPGAEGSAQHASLEKLRQMVASTPAMIGVLIELPTDRNRQKAYRLAEVVFGLRGILRLAKVEKETFSDHNADASFDSELSLLWWEPGTYPLAGRIANPLQHERLRKGPRPPLPVLMVSRLDAPTPALARQLVDKSLAAERQGLAGTVYLDAQGKLPGGPFTYGFYDESLRVTADLFRKRTSYAVVLENTDKRFSAPGEAPGVAVYVGWYRLRAYEDAFTFMPGAVGYHIASAEALSVHDPAETGWCKNALERGITVTLGSTGEPFVDAFPPPNEFLGLLMTGRYSLVEAYYLTSRFVSWRMVLFGDPLYNPWRGRHLAAMQDLALHSDGQPAAAAAPAAPADLPFNDPIETNHQLSEWRQSILTQVDAALGHLAQLSQYFPQ